MRFLDSELYSKSLKSVEMSDFAKKDEREGRPEHQWTIKDRPTMNISQAEGSGGVAMAPLFSPWEAEQRIESLVEFDVAEVGTGAWMKQHESLEQLNLQAHQSAQQGGDEYVLEALITFDKLKVLVHELLVVEAWRLNVFPRIKRGLSETKATMRGYFCLFHEATLVNLLAVCMHHAHAAEALGEAAVELVDYLARRLVDLNVRGRSWAGKGADSVDNVHVRKRERKEAAAVAAKGTGENAEEEKGEVEEDPSQGRAAAVREEAERSEQETPLEHLEGQASEVIFQVSVGCVTLVRYVCEHLNSMPLSVAVRALETHDLLCSLMPVLENPPWTRRLPKSGDWQKLVENSWVEVGVGDLLTLTKTEAQVWLTLFALVCNNEVRKRYHFNSFRKAQLLRARKYMNEVLLDQLPVLADVQRFMDELAMMDVAQPTSDQGGSSVLRMEQVGLMQEKISGGAKKRDWDQVAVAALGPKVFGAQSDASDTDLRRLVDQVYGLDGVDEVLAGEAEARKAELYSQPLGGLHLCVLTSPGHSETLRVHYALPASKAGGAASKPVMTPHGAFVRRRWCVERSAVADTTLAQDPRCCDVPFSRPGDSSKVDVVLQAVSAVEGEMEEATGGAWGGGAGKNATEAGAGEGAPPASVDQVLAAASAGNKAESGEGAAMPCVLKAELSFVGPTPVSIAVASEVVTFPSSDSDAAIPGGAFPRKMWVQLGAVKDKVAIQVQLVRASREVPYRVADAFVSTPAPMGEC